MTAYPVRTSVVTPPGPRNRLTVAFRPLLALPHTLLAGPIVWFYRSGSLGLLGAAAYFLAVVNWCSVLVTGTLIPGIRDFDLYYLRWRLRAVAYTALLVDQYPPFGDAPYPASIEIVEPAVRDRTSIALRLLFVLPHLVVLCFVLIAWFVTSVIAWVAILVTGAYPRALLPFGLGALQWLLRVEAYLLLLVDEYPPFTLEG
ncbi:MAG: DUF4389 domain-containing protein [Vicinamibacterales bacterium]